MLPFSRLNFSLVLALPMVDLTFSERNGRLAPASFLRACFCCSYNRNSHGVLMSDRSSSEIFFVPVAPDHCQISCLGIKLTKIYNAGFITHQIMENH